MSDALLEKVYNPEEVEEKWTTRWESSGVFHADSASNNPSFSMVIPPPNVTGVLHLGHALNNTLQDILARWKRMSGCNVLWLPGTDHAGIATQNVVERQLVKEGLDRHQLGREDFIKRIWLWKENSGGRILKQLKRLGASCDWERERFTLDTVLSRAVQEVFVRLYKEGLIHRDKRLINLCPHCRTALSDIEVEHEEVQGKMYYIQYPLADDPDTFLTVATTRPETMLGDTAVAVHPEDTRFNHLIGKRIKLPLTDRSIPIIPDPILVDRELGTGAVKITPGHDFNDEKSGKRHQLEKISLIDWSGEMNGFALRDEAKVSVDLSRDLTFQPMIKAREIVIEELKKEKILLKVENHVHSIGKCYRCKTVVEPFDSPQWFVKVNEPGHSLAQPAIDAVRQKKIKLIPSSWEANYFGWMENIEDWCISRQIWWGHQIPVWYCKKPGCDEGVFISHVGVGAVGEGAALPEPTEETVYIEINARPIVGETSCPKCGASDLVQDPDVLDTWFSSALWPFSTSGWPTVLQPDEEGRVEAEALLKRFYPTSTLVSGFDILFFWVARMIMMGLHFMKDVPFRDVYIHALVRDAKGQKMSKSKGNVVDPLELMDRHGTDALRFTLAAMASPGRDIQLSEERIEGYRNFCNKIWNAARFIQMNRPESDGETGLISVQKQQTVVGRWIQSRLNETIGSVNRALENYRFDEAAKSVYQFVWHTFCDWYLELSKVDLQEKESQGSAYLTMMSVFKQILKLLHPFMPFLTEELWEHFQKEKVFLAATAYPKVDVNKCDLSAEEVVYDVICDTVRAVRNLRGEMNIPPSEALSLLIKIKKEVDQVKFEKHLPYIKRLARIDSVSIGLTLKLPKMFAPALTRISEIYLPLDESRVRGEVSRIEKKLAKMERNLVVVEKKLNNPNFILNAPEGVVAKTKREQNALTEEKSRFKTNLRQFQTQLSRSLES
ncbi:MAG: valine--tRNA ligase [Nitrospiria bacterium]